MAMQHSTIPMTNALYAPLLRLEIKRASGTHQHPSDIGSDFLSRCDGSTYYIPCLKVVVPLPVGAMPCWKPTLISATHLTSAMPIGSDKQWDNESLVQGIRGTLAYTSRVTPVRLLKSSRYTVVFGYATTATLNG